MATGRSSAKRRRPSPAPTDTPAKQCGMVQTARSEKNDKVALTLVMVKGKQNGKDVTMMRVVAPIGVFLPTGVALEVDGGAVGRVPFTRCLPQVCIAFARGLAQTLDKMRKGTAANFIIYEAPGLGMPMKISLNGFSAAFTRPRQALRRMTPMSLSLLEKAGISRSEAAAILDDALTGAR